jgi:hypothetical protein
MFAQSQDFQKYEKSQNKAAKNRKRSDNENSDSYSDYLQSFFKKHHVSGQKR